MVLPICWKVTSSVSYIYIYAILHFFICQFNNNVNILMYGLLVYYTITTVRFYCHFIKDLGPLYVTDKKNFCNMSSYEN